jgi:hypothetical protein
MLKNKKTLFWLILSSFLLIPLIVSIISSIHVINFFELSNGRALAIALSVSFEIGALSALAGLVVMDKINKNVIYFIFILLTAYQMMGNTYFAYDMLSDKMVTNPDLIKNWSELFGFEIDDVISMKRIIAIISGAILPIVSLCFLDLSVDYIKKTTILEKEESDKNITLTEKIESPKEEITIVNTPERIEEIEEVISEEDKKNIRDMVNEVKDVEEVIVPEEVPQLYNRIPMSNSRGLQTVTYKG